MARTLLPSPVTHNENFFYVSVGDRASHFMVNAYVPTAAPHRMYIFHRDIIAGLPKKNQWICVDSRLQEIIYENRLQAMMLLSNLLKGME